MEKKSVQQDFIFPTHDEHCHSYCLFPSLFPCACPKNAPA